MEHIFQDFTFVWTDKIRQKYELPSDFIPLNNKKFTLGTSELPEKTIALTVDNFHHDTISFEQHFICRYKFIKQEPFEAQLQIYMTKDTTVLGVIVCDLRFMEPAPAPAPAPGSTDGESSIMAISTNEEKEGTILPSITNLVYYRFDKRQISYFKGDVLLYEFSGTQLHITKHCPSIIFDYGMIEYSPPMIMVLPAHTQSNSLYAAIHPSENLNRKYRLPATFEDPPKNILRYMLDSDFRELYKQWYDHAKKM